MDLTRDPIPFPDFEAIWQALEGSTNCHDAYDAYLAGVSEALQQAASTCPMDQTAGYMKRIVEVARMRRDHRLGTQDSITQLGRAMVERQRKPQ